MPETRLPAATSSRSSSRSGTIAAMDKQTPKDLPNERAALMALHRAARQRRDAAPRISHERVAATLEIERIEIHIAAIERAMDPPLV